jgi:holo-[acyl-carrier protein] synthase
VSGVGLDLLEIERLEAALARRPKLAERLFTDGERAYAAARSRPAQHLAARFCAKEAVAKALALEAWSWRDIEVVSPAGGGPPEVVLHGALAARDVVVDVSLTHSRGTAGAVAVVRS